MLFFFYYESVSGLVMREELHGQQWLEGLFLGQYINNKISRKTYNVLPLFSPNLYLADGSIVASCFLIVRECLLRGLVRCARCWPYVAVVCVAHCGAVRFRYLFVPLRLPVLAIWTGFPFGPRSILCSGFSFAR